MSVATSSAAKSTGERQTYWCHECDMSVSLSPLSRGPLACPHCFGDFLELMDSPLFPTTVDEGFLLDGPFLRRLIRHLSTSSAGDSGDLSSASLPASKAAVDALPTVAISSSLLEVDPFLLCAVCKDHFALADEARELPCKHLYHPGCILPWLAHHDSCPVCRFCLPAEESDCREGENAEEMVLRAEDNEDWFDYASTLRYIARRHNLVIPVSQAAEEETEGMAGSGSGNGEASVKFSLSPASENSRFVQFP